MSLTSTAATKRLSVERIYQKKTQLEHILLRPDSYVGSTEESTQKMWVFDRELEKIVSREVTYVPGLYKIFDEILGELMYMKNLSWLFWQRCTSQCG